MTFFVNLHYLSNRRSDMLNMILRGVSSQLVYVDLCNVACESECKIRLTSIQNKTWKLGGTTWDTLAASHRSVRYLLQH